jgi:signal transduction histidine kinase
MRLPLAFSHFEYDLWTGENVYQEGLVWSLETEFRSGLQLQFYDSFAMQAALEDEIQFSICPLGFPVCAFSLTPHVVVVIPGLNTDDTDIESPLGASRPVFTTSQIHDHINNVKTHFAGMKGAVNQELRAYVHEIKKINAAIINQSVQMITLVGRGDSLGQVKQVAYSLLGNASLLKMRSDLMQFVSNPDLSMQDQETNVAKSFQRICEMFRQTRAAKNLVMPIESDFMVTGPNLFDLVPFIVLENALKYSPENQNIRIGFSKVRSEGRVSVENYGPLIEPEEIDKIWWGYRSKAASDCVEEGEGIGLQTLRGIVENHFYGDINVNQFPDNVEYNGRKYYLTRFVMNFTLFS